MPEGSRLLILAPIIKDRKGNHKSVFENLQKQGFARARVNGELYELDRGSRPGSLQDAHHRSRHRPHCRAPQGVDENGEPTGTDMSRLADSVETALKLGNGVLIALRRERPRQPEGSHLQRALCLCEVRHEPA
jgi:excinuclease ABC subunit A